MPDTQVSGSISSPQPHKFIVRVGTNYRLGWYYDTKYSWDKQWTAIGDLRYLIRWTRETRQILQRVFVRYLPRKGKILEAGCGLGQWVAILREWGYDVEGIDLGAVSLRRARREFFGLPLYTADVSDLPFRDGCLAAYVSLGVVEHAEDGPQRALQEAYRVLAPGGVLLCAVPHLSLIRRAMIRRSLPVFAQDQIPHNELEFYQWAFSEVEFQGILHTAGFKAKAAISYDVRKTLRDELSFFRRVDSQMVQWQSAGVVKSRWTRQIRKLANLVLDNALLRRIGGHMQIYVADKR